MTGQPSPSPLTPEKEEKEKEKSAARLALIVTLVVALLGIGGTVLTAYITGRQGGNDLKRQLAASHSDMVAQLAATHQDLITQLNQTRSAQLADTKRATFVAFIASAEHALTLDEKNSPKYESTLRVDQARALMLCADQPKIQESIRAMAKSALAGDDARFTQVETTFVHLTGVVVSR